MEVSNYPKALEQLIEIVRLEQQAKGYPKRCKKMVYSRKVRALALEVSRLTRMSSVELAVITKLSKTTISNWRHRIKSEFCELAVRTDAEEIILEKSEKVEFRNHRRRDECIRVFSSMGIAIGV